MDYYFVWSIGFFFILLPGLFVLFVNFIGHFNYILWKSDSKRTKKELNEWSMQFIPGCGMNDRYMIYEAKWVYNTTFMLMVSFYIITAFITLIAIAGFIVVCFFDKLGVVLPAIWGTICCVSYLILFIVTVFHMILACKNK